MKLRVQHLEHIASLGDHGKANIRRLARWLSLNAGNDVSAIIQEMQCMGYVSGHDGYLKPGRVH